MRIATLAAAGLFLLAGAAAAAKGPVPPPALRGVHAIRLTAAPKRTGPRSCAALPGRVARKVAPVACEQPPRSQLQLEPAIAALLGE